MVPRRKIFSKSGKWDAENPDGAPTYLHGSWEYVLTARVPAKEPKMAEFWGGLKSNQRRSQRFYHVGVGGKLKHRQLRGCFLIFSSFFL